MNCLSIAGNVGRDAELRQVNTANGAQSVLSFAVAVKSSKKGDDGKYISDWFDCSLWGKRADSLAQYIKKGSSVAVFGEVSLEQYTTTQGQAGAKMKINVQNVTLLGGGQQQPQQAAQAPAQQPQQPQQQAYNPMNNSQVPQQPRPAPAQYNQAPNPQQFAQAPQQQYAASPQPIDFDDDIPFAPIALHCQRLLHCI